MKLFPIFLLLLTLSSACAQEPDSTRKILSRAIGRSISAGHDDKKCQGFKSAVFSIVVTFTSDAKVDNVFFSESPNCFYESRDRIKSQLMKNIKALNLKTSQFSNVYILSVVYVLPDDREKSAPNNIPSDWDLLFRGIDVSALKDKRFIYTIPLGMYLMARISN
jgi:hypothetical protein